MSTQIHIKILLHTDNAHFSIVHTILSLSVLYQTIHFYWMHVLYNLNKRESTSLKILSFLFLNIMQYACCMIKNYSTFAWVKKIESFLTNWMNDCLKIFFNRAGIHKISVVYTFKSPWMLALEKPFFVMYEYWIWTEDCSQTFVLSIFE